MHSFRQSLSLFLLFACVSSILLAPQASNTYVLSDFDLINHLAAIMQAKLAILEGQFPLRVAPLEQHGWHYPYFQFYSSTSFLFAGLIHRWLSPNNPFIAYKISLWCALTIGGIYMYRLAHWLTKSKPAAILASVVYLTSPYYIVVINHIIAFNEAIALGIVPAVLFYTLQKLYFPLKNSLLLQTALTWYLLATTHLITFVYFSLFFALLILFITLKETHLRKNLVGVGIAYLFGLALAMWQLAPAALLSKYLLISTTFNAFHTQSLGQLFSPAVHISHGLGATLDTIHPGIGLPVLIALGVYIYSLGKAKQPWVFPLFLLFLFVLFITWSPFDFWKWIPNSLKLAQYSWRFLGQAIWMGALLFAWAACWLFENKFEIKHVVIGVVLLISATSGWLIIPEMDYVVLEGLHKRPLLFFNVDTYLLNPAKNQLINKIDHAPLGHLIDEKTSTLKLDQPVFISRLLATATATPSISLKGTVPKNARDLTLTALINNKIVASHDLKPGPLQWTFPLKNIKHSTLHEIHFVTLQFQIMQDDKHIHSTLNIPVKSLTLQNLLKSPETISVSTLKPFCKHIQAKTICNMQIPKETQLLELPAIYYPDMLKITINGKEVPYSNVLHGITLIAAVVPESGKMNKITIEFRGLPWANYVSETTWYVWLIFLIWSTIQFLIIKFGLHSK